MSDYTNVGGQRVWIWEVDQWLEDRAIVAMPSIPTEEMVAAALDEIRKDGADIDPVDIELIYRAMRNARKPLQELARVT